MKTEPLLSDLSFEDVMEQSESESKDLTTSGKNSKSVKKDIDFLVKHTYGALSDRKMAPVFSLINWNGYDRYDLRTWRDNMSLPGKGITFTDEELENLSEALVRFDFAAPSISEHPKYIYHGSKVTANIYDTICLMSEQTIKGITWKKAVTWVDWNHGIKVDLRKWTADYEKCSKGICISVEELKNLYSIIRSL